MARRDALSGYHPLVAFAFFALVFVCSMVLMEPLCLLLSLSSALWYDGALHGKRAARFALRCTLPVGLLAAILNPAFSHAGATILTYFPTGNPLTMESILYGLAAAAMLAAVVTWCRCASAVLTEDKFVYLFGRILPALSLVLALSLRFIPLCSAKVRAIRAARRALGGEKPRGGLARLREGGKILSILVTWCLENAIETANSMKSRGYGLPGRTAFSIYRFEKRDALALLWLGACAGLLLLGALCGALDWRYFPTVQGAALSAPAVLCRALYGALCFAPIYWNGKEGRQWKRLRSEI